MPALQHDGPWSVWDIRALRCTERPAAIRPVAGSDVWDRNRRYLAMSDETNGRSKSGSRGGEERLEVLRLLQAGEITADEAAQLLDALDRSEAGARGVGVEPGTPMTGRKGGSFRLRVSNSATGKSNVNLSLPLGLIGAGVAVAKRFAPEHVPDPDRLREAIATGLQGKILDVDDDGERVEIWVE